jgi:hypothetical protein
MIVLDVTTFRDYVWQSRIITALTSVLGGSIAAFPNGRLLGYIMIAQ